MNIRDWFAAVITRVRRDKAREGNLDALTGADRRPGRSRMSTADIRRAPGRTTGFPRSLSYFDTELHEKHED